MLFILGVCFPLAHDSLLVEQHRGSGVPRVEVDQSEFDLDGVSIEHNSDLEIVVPRLPMMVPGHCGPVACAIDEVIAKGRISMRMDEMVRNTLIPLWPICESPVQLLQLRSS